jgi:hypothetical protein
MERDGIRVFHTPSFRTTTVIKRASKLVTFYT